MYCTLTQLIFLIRKWSVCNLIFFFFFSFVVQVFALKMFFSKSEKGSYLALCHESPSPFVFQHGLFCPCVCLDLISDDQITGEDKPWPVEAYNLCLFFSRLHHDRHLQPLI